MSTITVSKNPQLASEVWKKLGSIRQSMKAI